MDNKILVTLIDEGTNEYDLLLTKEQIDFISWCQFVGINFNHPETNYEVQGRG